ncbi:MAG: Lrp/AsnC family transcriptional regulator [Candidatus Bilamarchaeaceae archaeon]
MLKVDKLDIQILKELKENSRLSYKEIAKRLRTHPNTLIQRVKKLEKNQIIKKYSIEADYKKLGLEFCAVVMLRTKGIKITTKKDFERITRLPQVVTLYGIAGTYDAVAIIQVKNMDELTHVISEIQKTPGVLRTTTYLVLEKYKDIDEYNPFI